MIKVWLQPQGCTGSAKKILDKKESIEDGRFHIIAYRDPYLRSGRHADRSIIFPGF
jgi:hypothetical protein